MCVNVPLSSRSFSAGREVGDAHRVPEPGVIWKPLGLLLSLASHFNLSVEPRAPPPLGSRSSRTELRARQAGVARKLIPLHSPGMRASTNAWPLSWALRSLGTYHER